MKNIKICLKLYAFLLTVFFLFPDYKVQAQEADVTTITPEKYENALKNPLKGFTTRGISGHRWASTAHTYIRWNELENDESDGIEKIINFSNNKWKGVAAANVKVIPRVYLHWDGDQKYWPADMQKDDYSSAQFKERVVRLIKRLGICWDNDPRIAFVEMGIFGKWGEQEQPAATYEIQKLVSDAFADAFKNKKVSVREVWSQFTQHPYGEYWDSWGHFDQMWGHGNSINKVNNNKGRYLENYIGGEVAYNWGNSDIQPGPSPTASVAEEKHRNFIINTIRWLHCTQLRWIDAYDPLNTPAVAGAEEIQKAFGYRYVLNEVRFSMNDSLNVEFDVTNTGSAPFYYNWPVEVALLDSTSHEPVWKAKMKNVDIRNWKPGEGWTDPNWKYVGSWQEYQPDQNWNASQLSDWTTPPQVNKVAEKFKVDLPAGTYILSLSILDPAGDLPAVKFATKNYLNGAWHPFGLVAVAENKCYPLPSGFHFDEPDKDNSLYYDDKFEITYETDPVQTSFNGKNWMFPADTVSAWQYDFINNYSGDKYFSLDSAKTIGIYSCNDTSGTNIRAYQDSVLNPCAAQFNWNQTDKTLQKNGQWLEFTTDFNLDVPFQLLLRARNNMNTNFKLTISGTKGETVFFKDFNIENDFKNLGGGNEATDWYFSKMAIGGLLGTYVVRFDWYDNIGESGVFGAFSFLESELDVTPPKWYFVSVGTFAPGTNLLVMTTENATVYLVPADTPADTTSIEAAAVSVSGVIAYNQSSVTTAGAIPGDYVLYAIDSSKNISEASKTIKLQYPVGIADLSSDSDISITYNNVSHFIQIQSKKQLQNISVYNVSGIKLGTVNCDGYSCKYQTSKLVNGIYLVNIVYSNGAPSTRKIFVR